MQIITFKFAPMIKLFQQNHLKESNCLKEWNKRSPDPGQAL